MVMMLIAAADASVWPVTASGWVALVTSIVTFLIVVIGGFMAYGKWIERMNGFGERLEKVEVEQERAEGSAVERIRQFDEVMHEQRTIIAAIARAEKTSETCREEADQHALAIGSRLSESLTRITTMELHLSQRMTAVETALKLNPRDAR